MEHYAVTREDKTMQVIAAWVELQNTMLSEASLKEKDKDQIFSIICSI